MKPWFLLMSGAAATGAVQHSRIQSRRRASIVQVTNDGSTRRQHQIAEADIVEQCPQEHVERDKSTPR
jgi:hypothetical protein